MKHEQLKILRPVRWKHLAALPLWLALLGIGVWAIVDGSTLFVIAAIPVALIALAGLVPSLAVLVTNRCYLRLDETGFTIGTLAGQRTLAWEDVSHFVVAPLGRRKMVACEITRSNIPANKRRPALLPNTYGLAPEALAALLNQWRERRLLTAKQTTDTAEKT